MKFWPTTRNMEGAYEFIRTLHPFIKLGLPDHDELKLRVSGHVDRYGHFKPAGKKGGFHEILISAKNVTSCTMLQATMAHEMLHLYQERRGTNSSVQHNAEFNRLARIFCRTNGFEFDTFL